ncbi:hypothetical protein EON63_23245 [archaeon]|nr:MAG: hypothetical protein EON63_23245 [archaeon]
MLQKVSGSFSYDTEMFITAIVGDLGAALHDRLTILDVASAAAGMRRVRKAKCALAVPSMSKTRQKAEAC